MGHKKGFRCDADAREQHPRVKAREEQDPIWDVRTAPRLPTIGREEKEVQSLDVTGEQAGSESR